MSFIDGAVCDAVFLLLHLIQWTVMNVLFREVRNLHVYCGQQAFNVKSGPFAHVSKRGRWVLNISVI